MSTEFQMTAMNLEALRSRYAYLYPIALLMEARPDAQFFQVTDSILKASLSPVEYVGLYTNEIAAVIEMARLIRIYREFQHDETVKRTNAKWDLDISEGKE